MDFQELRFALVEAMKNVSDFILNNDLKKYSSLHDLQHAKKSIDDQTRQVDTHALRIIKDSLKAHLPATKALLVSEENPIGEPLSFSNGLPDLLFLIDPIDNTDGAIHGGVPFSAISVYSRVKATVIAAAVADPILRQIYYADDELEGAMRYPLSDKPGVFSGNALLPNARDEISGAYIAIYTLKPSRLSSVSKAKQLLTALGDGGRVECLGGAVALCRVAAGYIDAAVEFAKGFQAYDLFPGAFILKKSGGVCAKPDHMEDVSLMLSFSDQSEISDTVRRRQIFIGTGTIKLFNRIQTLLLKDDIGFDDCPLTRSSSE